MDSQMKLPEEPMESKTLKALLIGESPQGVSYLAKCMQERGCRCEFATSREKAYSLLSAQAFDLVLSPMWLHDGSLFPLIDLLDGSGVTLFYSHAVENGCWWLPALRYGQKCFESSALHPSEFVRALDEVIEAIQSGRDVTGKAQQSPVQQFTGAVFVASSSWVESRPADPVLAKTSALVKRKAAG
jgi:DNA-binding NtrC family response regulator